MLIEFFVTLHKKVSAEVADISETMRKALDTGYQQTTMWLAEQIKAGWIDGSVPRHDNISAESMAKRWYFAWLGASLMAKISQTNTPLAEIWQMTTTQMGRAARVRLGARVRSL